jgi:hypothetical protein
MKAFVKTMFKIFLTTVTILMTIQVSGQDSLYSIDVYPTDISLAYGIGNYNIRDNYISGEKYDGGLPYYSVGWARNHDKYVYQLEMVYRNSSKIKNYNVSAEITQLALNQGFLYSLKRLSLLKNSLYIRLGPTSEFFLLYNKPNIAVSGFDYAQSFAGLLSLGFRTVAVYPVYKRFHVESSLNLSLLSLGLRMVDSEESNESPVKLLTLFTGLNSLFRFGVRYYLFNHLSAQLAYEFGYVRISAWESLYAASDNMVFGLNYRF